jgi:hypothetical protein
MSHWSPAFKTDFVKSSLHIMSLRSIQVAACSKNFSFLTKELQLITRSLPAFLQSRTSSRAPNMNMVACLGLLLSHYMLLYFLQRETWTQLFPLHPVIF